MVWWDWQNSRIWSRCFDLWNEPNDNRHDGQQPAVNGARSDHPIFGWGGPGGRVYQKAYIECFCSPQNLKRCVFVLNV